MSIKLFNFIFFYGFVCAMPKYIYLRLCLSKYSSRFKYYCNTNYKSKPFPHFIDLLSTNDIYQRWNNCMLRTFKDLNLLRPLLD